MAVYDSKYNGAGLDNALDDALSHIQNTSNPHSVTKSQVGLSNVGNFKAVSTEANQSLSNTEKGNARTNLGLGSMATKDSLAESDIPSIHKSKISDFPSSMPASDVYDWAKASTKPTYTASEVGACPNNDSRLSDARVAANIDVVVPLFSGDTQVELSVVALVLSDYSTGSVTFVYNNETSTDCIITVPTTYTGYTIRTPDGNPIELTCPAGGYCEVSVLKKNLVLFIRGI